MTSLLRADVSVPMLAWRSSNSVLEAVDDVEEEEDECCASARAVASPITPPPITYVPRFMVS